MKINAKICPKGCKVGTTKRQRMQITTQNISVPRSISRPIQYRKEIRLNWHCPNCGYTVPVAMEDVRYESRHRATHA
jgi:hypothetical protein